MTGFCNTTTSKCRNAQDEDYCQVGGIGWGTVSSEIGETDVDCGGPGWLRTCVMTRRCALLDQTARAVSVMKVFVPAVRTDGKMVERHLLIVEVKCAVRVRIRRRALWMPIAAAPAVTLELVGLVLMAFRMATKQQLIVVERLVYRM